MAEKNAPEPSPIAEISHGPSAFEEFLDKNQKMLIILGIAIALGLAAWVVKEGVREGAYLEAGNALISAEDATALEEVMKNHAGTPSAASAAVLLSDAQWEQGQQDDAIATLEAEISANPEHPATAPAYARLAARLASQGKSEEAKVAFQTIIDRPQAAFYAPYALISLGQIAKAEGNLDKAKDFFRQASEGYPGNPFANAASTAMQFSDFKMPEQVDPPEPETLDNEIPPTDFDPTSLSNGQANPLFPSTKSPTDSNPVNLPELQSPPAVDTPGADPSAETSNEEPAGEKESSPDADK